MTNEKPTIAVIGLGIMGGPMAANLVKAGYDVIGYNRSRAKVDTLVEAGGRGADSIAEAVHDADVIITIVPDSPDVEDVAQGEDGIFAHAKPGAVWVDCSSIRPDVSARLAEAGREAGIRVLDAPVSGGEAGAKEAKLSIMVGGEEADFEEVRPILEAIGSTIVLVGPAGSGQTVKAANQLIVAGNYELVAEAIVFLRAYGVDTEAAIEVLAGGLAGSTDPGPQGGLHGGRRVRARLPDRPAPQGHGHHPRGGPREGRDHPARGRHRPADRSRCAPRRRWSRPLGPAARVERLSGQKVSGE